MNRREVLMTRALTGEQVWLWGDLEVAVRTAHNGVWSLRCDDLARRIIRIARIVGATAWADVPVTLLRSGLYERILAGAGVPYPPVDWDAVTKTEEFIAQGASRG